MLSNFKFYDINYAKLIVHGFIYSTRISNYNKNVFRQNIFIFFDRFTFKYIKEHYEENRKITSARFLPENRDFFTLRFSIRKKKEGKAYFTQYYHSDKFTCFLFHSASISRVLKLFSTFMRKSIVIFAIKTIIVDIKMKNKTVFSNKTWAPPLP